jgi:hypothetical protein
VPASHKVVAPRLGVSFFHDDAKVRQLDVSLDFGLERLHVRSMADVVFVNPPEFSGGGRYSIMQFTQTTRIRTPMFLAPDHDFLTQLESNLPSEFVWLDIAAADPRHCVVADNFNNILFLCSAGVPRGDEAERGLGWTNSQPSAGSLTINCQRSSAIEKFSDIECFPGAAAERSGGRNDLNLVRKGRFIITSKASDRTNESARRRRRNLCMLGPSCGIAIPSRRGEEAGLLVENAR